MNLAADVKANCSIESFLVDQRSQESQGTRREGCGPTAARSLNHLSGASRRLLGAMSCLRGPASACGAGCSTQNSADSGIIFSGGLRAGRGVITRRRREHPEGVRPIDAGKSRFDIEVPGLDLSLPATRLNGRDGGPRLLVTAGVHGGEYPAIEAAKRLSQELDPGELNGTVTIVHLVSPASFFARRQYVNPQDGKNPNRYFPGDPAGTASERITHRMMALAREHDAWVDLHGGDIHEALVPFTLVSNAGQPETARRALELAQAFGLPRLVVTATVGGSSYVAAALAGVPAILAEAGGLGQLDPEAVGQLRDGLDRVLVSLGMVAGPALAASEIRQFSQFAWNRAEASGLWYPEKTAGESAEAGESVGKITDPYGDVLQEVKAPASGEILFSVRSLAIESGDPLLAVAL